MSTSNSSNSISSAIVRILLYSVVVAAVVMVFTLEAKFRGGPDLYSEDSWTEWLEVTFLFITTIILIVIGKKETREESLTTLMAGLTTIAIIREFDFFLDAQVFDGAWQTLATITAIVTSVIVYKKRATLKNAIQTFLSRPCFGIFLSSFLTIIVFSRLFGRKVLWYEIMGNDGFIRAVKNGAEEGTELFGYCLMVIAALEFYREIRAEKKR